MLFYSRWLHLQHVRLDDRSSQVVPAAQVARHEIHQGPAHHVHLQTRKFKDFAKQSLIYDLIKTV